MFEERHSLCSKKNIPCVRRRTSPVFQEDETPIFGRTDLRKGVSEAKFDAEADFDVKKCLAPPKSAENREKLKKKSEKFPKKSFGVKKSKVANRLERALPNSCRSELCSKGKWTFEVRHYFRIFEFT